MAIDREALKGQLATQKAKREGSFAQYIKKDTTRNLRITEFVDAEGNTQFARTVVHFRSADGKTTYLDRQRTFGVTCAATKMEENASAIGADSPFQRRQTQYYMNAIDVDKKPHKVEIFALPTTVWEAIATMLVSEEWENVLEQENGHSFSITRKGSGLDTEYEVVVSRKPWPVSDELMAKVRDPYQAVQDTGLEGQCKALGVTVEDVFPDGIEGLEGIEPITFDGEAPAEPTPAPTPKAKPVAAAAGKVAAAKAPAPKPVAAPAAAPKAKPVQKKVEPPPPPEEEEATIEEGSRVSCLIEGMEGEQEGTVASIDGDDATVDFDFDDTMQYVLPVADLTLITEEPAAEETDLPVVTKTPVKAGAKATATATAGKLGGKPPASKPGKK